MKNRELFMENMTMLGEIFGKEISEVLIKAYWEILKPFTDKQCEDAFKRIMLGSTFFPKPVEIIQFIQGTAEDMSIAGWVEVVKALEQYNPDFPESIPKLSSVTARSIRPLGGLDALARMNFDELKWQEKRFRENFESFSERGDYDLLEMGENELIEEKQELVGIAFKGKEL